MRALGFELKLEEIKKILASINTNNSGVIYYNVFLDIMTQKMAERDPKEEWLKFIRQFEDETGRISFEKVKRVAKELGENMTDDDI